MDLIFLELRSRDAILVGQPESDIPPRDRRRVPTALCARATPFTTVTTSSVLGTPDESRTDFRTSQWEVSGFRRGTGTSTYKQNPASWGTPCYGLSCYLRSNIPLNA
jgi:hypothetical protein